MRRPLSWPATSKGNPVSSAAAASLSGPATDAATPKKGKRKLIMALLAVLVLGAGGGGAWYFMTQRHAAGAAHEPVPVVKVPPTFLPMDSMVVNLADTAGDRMVQLAITLQLADAKAVDQIKAYMPSIRSAILVLVSQRTSQELLLPEGKASLAGAISREIAVQLGIAPAAAPAATPVAAEHKPAVAAAPEAGASAPAVAAPPPVQHVAAAKPANPVQGVLFSSFIIQ